MSRKKAEPAKPEDVAAPGEMAELEKSADQIVPESVDGDPIALAAVPVEAVSPFDSDHGDMDGARKVAAQAYDAYAKGEGYKVPASADTFEGLNLLEKYGLIYHVLMVKADPFAKPVGAFMGAGKVRSAVRSLDTEIRRAMGYADFAHEADPE